MPAKTEVNKSVFIRLPVKLIRQVDAHAQKLRESTGMNVTRTDAVRALLTQALGKKGKK